jgi:SulP family sulfate permease
VGVVLSGLFFAGKVRRMFTVASSLSADGRTRTYRVAGEIFFASAERFAEAFDFHEALDRVVIDLTAAHFWDITAVGVLDKAVLRLRREGVAVEVLGLNTASAAMVERFGVHHKPLAAPLIPAH